MPPDPVTRLLLDVRRRRTLFDLALAAAAAIGVGAIVDWIGAPGVTAVLGGLAVAGVLFTLNRGERTLAAAARAIERIRPPCRNVVVTAEELTRHPERASGWMATRVAQDASRAVQGLGADDVVSATRTWLAAVGAVLVVVAAWFGPEPRRAAATMSEIARSAAGLVRGGTSLRVSVTIRPPEYSRLEPRTLVNPARLDVLEGSRLTFVLSDGRASVLRLGSREVGTLVPDGPGVQVLARDSGYVAIEPQQRDAARVLIALAVRRDESPVVRIQQPAKDLLLPDADRAVPLNISAADDLELASLELRYTKVSGAGETFQFQEGTLPLQVVRGSNREWRADGEIALRALKLEAGESLVYRAVARDRRPGAAGAGASDTYFIEIAGPGQVPLEGVEMPPDEERYALSQQMIVLKIERLKARVRGMSRDALVEEAALIAAEQRAVRANFIFLLGGHVEDEEVEAEQSHEIAEGRLENTARRDINTAIGDMTRAERSLVAADTGVALPPARSAVEALQRAFGRSRYLLRTMPVRSRIDPSRRLAGSLTGASTWDRRAPEAPAREGNAARFVLSELADLTDAVARAATIDPRAVEQVAETALAVDPSSATWQEISRRILALRDRIDRSALEDVAQLVAAEASKGLVPQSPLARPKSALERAWEQAGRR